MRTETDSLGEVDIADDALWGVQTQRAIDNFPVSGTPLPAQFVSALGLIKACAATANRDLDILDADIANAICAAADEIAEGGHLEQFPVDVYQTGSGTSSNMNANEVIANLSAQHTSGSVHPNDHVNCGQSSNDLIPTAIHVATTLALVNELLPSLAVLVDSLTRKSNALVGVIKTGRTHLMDAMPLSMGQELSGWRDQIVLCQQRLEDTLPRLRQLAIGGTAVGTGVNAHPQFAQHFCAVLSDRTDIEFSPTPYRFAAQSSQDTVVELSGQLKTVAVALMKISNDLRLMNSGPLSGLGEIALSALQPGSSIMPGKVNPVVAEAAGMVAAKVIGNDTTISVAGQAGQFQLNTMLPVIASCSLESIVILTNICGLIARDAIDDFEVNAENLEQNLSRNPVLVTALNSEIGYSRAAEIAKKAYAEGRPVMDVAAEMTDIPEERLKELLDPGSLI